MEGGLTKEKRRARNDEAATETHLDVPSRCAGCDVVQGWERDGGGEGKKKEEVRGGQALSVRREMQLQ